jgi:hypothetical protein
MQERIESPDRSACKVRDYWLDNLGSVTGSSGRASCPVGTRESKRPERKADTRRLHSPLYHGAYAQAPVHRMGKRNVSKENSN